MYVPLPSPAFTRTNARFIDGLPLAPDALCRAHVLPDAPHLLRPAHTAAPLRQPHRPACSHVLHAEPAQAPADGDANRRRPPAATAACVARLPCAAALIRRRRWRRRQLLPATPPAHLAAARALLHDTAAGRPLRGRVRGGGRACGRSGARVLRHAADVRLAAAAAAARARAVVARLFVGRRRRQARARGGGGSRWRGRGREEWLALGQRGRGLLYIFAPCVRRAQGSRRCLVLCRWRAILGRCISDHKDSVLLTLS
ncbi:hypothetical protein BV25DRAFT_1438722 [Artomyces pyxidatus]|uniref:Uncharacterized protein n=1 Tax=Artomyces pyxidatus TaxID=48021 RepID=A0ACB8SND5_9AGAM|nr:hypothetical protein BV25DRAFT_1438722 [Artomyces pyxidatus]